RSMMIACGFERCTEHPAPDRDAPWLTQDRHGPGGHLARIGMKHSDRLMKSRPQRAREEAMKVSARATILTAALVIAAASGFSRPSDAADPVRIGGFVSASGPGSFLG